MTVIPSNYTTFPDISQPLCAKTVDSLSLTSTIPTEIGKLTALNYLMIRKLIYNCLSDYCWIFYRVRHLLFAIRTLLDNNTLTGSFPTEIGELTALQSLVISKSFLESEFVE